MPRTEWIHRFVLRMSELGTTGALASIQAKAAEVWDTRGHSDPVETADAAWPAGLPHSRGI